MLPLFGSRPGVRTGAIFRLSVPCVRFPQSTAADATQPPPPYLPPPGTSMGTPGLAGAQFLCWSLSVAPNLIHIQELLYLFAEN
ncbi:hypothetical protein GBF38_004000 [Nibea albiflora]|uniref:Uncharacterized protein n=1 Tax=Nibea albiflora TaxID=240163 RepID=A0ACB7FB78_NIBAL|nr:hypothetical protein GBF38_004000 [Nibea albiflora]